MAPTHLGPVQPARLDRGGYGYALQDDDGFIVGGLGISSEQSHGARQLTAEYPGRTAVEPPRDRDQPITAELVSGFVRRFRHSVRIQHHQIAGQRLEDGLAVAALGQPPPRCSSNRDSVCLRSWVCLFQGSLVMKYLAMGVPAYFLPINRAKSSTELRGRWFTTRCCAFPAALRVTVTTTLVGSP